MIFLMIKIVVKITYLKNSCDKIILNVGVSAIIEKTLLAIENWQNLLLFYDILSYTIKKCHKIHYILLLFNTYWKFETVKSYFQFFKFEKYLLVIFH